MTKGGTLILSPCTKNKCIDYELDSACIVPTDYLTVGNNVNALTVAREEALGLAGSQYDPESKIVYAFDLYVRHPRTQLYRNLRESGIDKKARQAMVEKRFAGEWFFISGGYGLVHALECIRSYQATFNRQIAIQEKIPYTKNIWRVLPEIIDDLISTLKPSMTCVFGPIDYVNIILSTNEYSNNPNSFRIFCGRATTPNIRNALASLVSGLAAAGPAV